MFRASPISPVLIRAERPTPKVSALARIERIAAKSMATLATTIISVRTRMRGGRMV